MNKKLYTISCLLILILGIHIKSGYSEDIKNSIFGYVNDKSTGDPIEDVNVYVSNTTWGSSTNKDGYFKIRQIPVGMQEVVVTIVGYQYESKKILVKKDSQIKLKFNLNPIIYETDPTLVEGTIPTKWYDDLDFFKRYFLGQTAFSEACFIENEIYLEFKEPNDTFFMATVDRPLIIINKALGYRIDCVLVNFLYNYDKNKWSWAIKPKFSKLESDDPDQILKWQQNRKTAYQGSLYHFLKSFRYGELEEEGFYIFKVNAGGQKVARQLWHPTLVEYEDYISDGIMDTEKKLHFDKWLFVVYKKTATSWIGLNFKDITLDEFGYAEEDNPYEVYGNWARRAIADLLPKNYTIE
jgi:hypothetical protein